MSEEEVCIAYNTYDAHLTGLKQDGSRMEAGWEQDGNRGRREDLPSARTSNRGGTGIFYWKRMSQKRGNWGAQFPGTATYWTWPILNSQRADFSTE
ncbi:hypothetical protein HJC23_008930 [Cyclotella cryptica]|uniref:Uncharacterized protein n=1 Tax=Cyclotella cryptica TaxID=29204 RepID=A0ABD3Q1Y3_9STRA